jgi:asparagine synthase (glutamine-hydrolysing)
MAEVGSGAVKTFSIGFDEAQYNELPYARLVAERFGTDHHELVVRPDALSILPTLAWHYDEPFADESAIPTYYVSQMTRRHVTVALNGDGGDESFAGYRRYLPSRTEAVAGRIPSDVRDGLARLLRRVPMRDHASVRYAQEVFASPERRHAHRLMHFKPWMKARLCTPAFTAAAGSSDEAQYMLDAFARSDGRAFLDRALHADIATYLADGLLVKVDIAAMANSLEGRSPLLDHEVMEFAARLPVTMKLHGLARKRLLRRVARRLLPAELFDHPKTGFGVPLDAWFRKELRPLADDLLMDGRLARRGYFDMAFVAGMIREHGDGTRQWHDQLWNLVMLESWHRTFVDVRPARPAATSLAHATAGPHID